MHYWNLEALREAYLDRQQYYECLQEKIHQKLQKELQLEGIGCEIQTRIKSVDSFVKKSLRKKYESPITEIKDQLGFRIIASYESELDKINEIICRDFKIHHSENKLDTLEYDRLGYLGIHLEASALGAEGCHNLEHGELVFEIQLHTKAQNLWASISHQLSYKPSGNKPSADIQRAIYRLIALIEIFDKEVTSVHKAVSTQPSFPEAYLLEPLERLFRILSSRDFDREYSIHNLEILKELLSQEEINSYDKIIESFFKENEYALRRLFDNYSEDDKNQYSDLILFQPESLLIFERLEKDKFKLLSVWRKTLPLELLKFLANIWSVNLPDFY